MSRRKSIAPFPCFFLLAFLSIEVSAETAAGVEEGTGLEYWEWRQDGVSVRFVERLPDQTRAFFLGRGFSSKHADIIGRSCVFLTIFRNQGKLPVEYDISDWRIHHGNAEQQPQTRETWEQLWETEGIEQPARIAFRWSLLPTRQHYEPGDYNWGMTSFGLAPGTEFGLSFSVDIGGKRATGLFPELRCGPEHP